MHYTFQVNFVLKKWLCF